MTLVLAAAQVVQRQNGNRRPAGTDPSGGGALDRLLCHSVRHPLVDSDRSRDVFKTLLAAVGKKTLDLTLYLIVNNRRYANSSRRGMRFQSCGEIYAITENLPSVLNHIA